MKLEEQIQHKKPHQNLNIEDNTRGGGGNIHIF
jgi:hypothetical protein